LQSKYKSVTFPRKKRVNGSKRKIINKVATKAKGLYMGSADRLAKDYGICAEKNWENGRLKEEICPSHSPYHYTA
jgi:hypothetical protein